MIGNVIQSQFLSLRNYPTAAALSFVLMGAILVARPHLRAGARHRPAHGGDGRMSVGSRRHVLDAYAVLALAVSLRADQRRHRVLVQQPDRPLQLHVAGVHVHELDAPASTTRGCSGAVRISIEIAFLSSLVATILGTLIALALVRYRFRGSATTNLLIFIPMTTPEIVMGASLLTLFLNWRIPQGFGTILIAHIMFNISYVVVTVRARLVGFDRHLEEAAMDLGANELVTFFRVTLPLIAPGILAAGLLAFALSIDDFVITYFNAGTTITFPLFVWGAARVAVPPQINVIGTAIFVVAVGGMLANVLFQNRRARRLA